ncbi:lipoprotein LpqH [Mycobacterium sp. MBM]|nr:lipoprotein LpqH [Mycobacterium sp. MBM]
MRAVFSGMLAVILTATGCSAAGHEVRGTDIARVTINGSEIGEPLVVGCNQAQWVWFIESTQDAPGFTAQVRTGASVDGLLVRLQGLGGFTGSAWNATGADTRVDAEVTDGTFTISGTATGSYDDDPAATATANFEIRTNC